MVTTMVTARANVMIVVMIVVRMATFVRLTVARPPALLHRLWGQYRAPVGREHAAGGCRAQRPYERSDLRLFRREREVLGIRWGDGRDVRWWW